MILFWHKTMVFFAHKKTSKKKVNSHIFNMITKKVIHVVFLLRNTHLKILELFCSLNIVQKSSRL